MGCLGALIVIGIVIAAFSASPVAGVVALAVLVGPFLIGAGRLYLTSTGREFRGAKGQEFIAAWESRHGPMRGNHRPSKTDAERWLAAHDATGISAANWLDGMRQTPAQPRAQGYRRVNEERSPKERPPAPFRPRSDGYGSARAERSAGDQPPAPAHSGIPDLRGSGHWTRASFLPDVAEKIPCTFKADPRGMVVHLSGQPWETFVPWTDFTGFKSYGGAGILLMQGLDTAVIDIAPSESLDRQRWVEALQAAGIENRTD